MFFLDLKRAAVAIASGRLDEAFQVLQTSSERDHRDGQKLTDRLMAALVERAQQHLADDRLDDARHDGDNALQLGGRTPDVTALLQKISVAEADRRHRQQQRNDVLASARQQLQAGAYSVGANLLSNLDEHQSAAGAASAERLASSIQTKRAVVDAATTKIQAAIDAGDYESAVAIISGLAADHRAHAKIAAVTRQAVRPLVDRGFSELSTGRLDRAAAIDDLLGPLQAASTDVGELQQCLSRCRSVREHLAAHRYVEAESQLSALAQMIDGATWIDAARTAVADALRNLNSLSAGPLGLLVNQPAEHQRSAASMPLRQRVARVDPFGGGGGGFPVRSVLQVDGIGGLLLLSGSVVTIGTSSSSSTAEIDVPLLTEGPATSISIRRDGDDYFAESTATFTVNGQPVTRRLLTSGDSIAVGTRGRLRFLKPVAASGSAVLQITGSRLARRDIRSVVLMADSLLFGPPGSHFRIPGTETPLVLHCRRDGYALREAAARGTASQPVVRNAATPICVGESVVMHETRFALMEA